MTLCILCIDDEPTGLEIRKMLLESRGYSVLTALSGPQGLDLLASNPVDAIIVDYAMPGMNGGQVAAEIRRRNPGAKIMLLSAYVDLPEEATRWVDRRAVKGVAPLLFLDELQQLLAAPVRHVN